MISHDCFWLNKLFQFFFSNRLFRIIENSIGILSVYDNILNLKAKINSIFYKTILIEIQL